MEYGAACTNVYTTEDFTARNWLKRKGFVANKAMSRMLVHPFLIHIRMGVDAARMRKEKRLDRQCTIYSFCPTIIDNIYMYVYPWVK